MITGAAQMDGGILVVGKLVQSFNICDVEVPLVMDVAIERAAILCPVII